MIRPEMRMRIVKAPMHTASALNLAFAQTFSNSNLFSPEISRPVWIQCGISHSRDNALPLAAREISQISTIICNGIDPFCRPFKLFDLQSSRSPCQPPSSSARLAPRPSDGSLSAGTQIGLSLMIPGLLPFMIGRTWS
jgi:hypothetical protein